MATPATAPLTPHHAADSLALVTPMKKWVFGCLGLFLVVAIAGGYAVYRFVYLPGRAYVASFAQLQVVPELHAQIENQEMFSPPADHGLTGDRVNRFVQAQRAIQTGMGPRIQELESRYAVLDPDRRGEGREPNLGEALAALKDIAGLYVEAKRVQVQALNAHGFSLAEYEWTRDRVYQALGLPIDTTLQAVLSAVAKGEKPDTEALENPPPPPPVPEKNRELVRAYQEELTNRAPFVFFGL